MLIEPRKLLLIWSLLTILGPMGAGAAEVCAPPRLETKLIRAQGVKIAKEKGYTQGLFFARGNLYESLGLKGRSALRRIDPYTAMPTTLRVIDPKYFAEGLTEVNGVIVQLTYQQDVAFMYGANDVMISHPGEAWGLTQMNGELIQSDGSSTLSFLDPVTLAKRHSIRVHDNKKYYNNLNELEAARGIILANIFGEDWIAMINPTTGCMFGRIDLSALRTPETHDPTDAKCKEAVCVKEDFAANGIAYDEMKDELYFTGKNWPYIFVFKFPQ
ncbi:MAG: glutaminyl-peptide cyclotransferase [Bdellovibrionales bacterium]